MTEETSEHHDFLIANDYFDYDHPDVVALAKEILSDVTDDKTQQVQQLYLAVRDRYAYNPYRFSTRPEQFKASYCASQNESYCIPKAVLFGALCRSIGIPARLGLVDVKNHISSPRLLETLKTDVFVMHGYAEVFIHDHWVKATPAFDANLCQYLKIKPLEFDATNDSVFQEYNLDGARHMEYLADHGTFATVPVQRINEAVQSAYPHLDFNSDGDPFKLNRSLQADLTSE